MKEKDYYIKRCFDLAKRGWGRVSPNPMVGAVLVYNDRIIGEGWHQIFGGPHAEVNAINSVVEEDKIHIKESTLYVSLEPCNFFGKTPPCSELILKYGIKKLVISNIDPTPEVSGKSIDYLKSKGVEVESGILKKEGLHLIQYRKSYVENKRPFIQIKYAVSADDYIGDSNQRIMLSNELSKRFVHKLRTKADAIMVGANTALIDDPLLNAREWPGKSPIKILIDPSLKVPLSSNIFSTGSNVKVFNKKINKTVDKIEWLCPEPGEDFLDFILSDLYKAGIGTLLVEGGRYTIQQFLDRGFYDEIYVIRTRKILDQGVKEPAIIDDLTDILKLKEDLIQYFSVI